MIHAGTMSTGSANNLACAQCLRQNFGIGGNEIDGGHRIQELTRHESDDLLVMRRDASDAGHRAVPPLLIQKKPLIDEIEGKILPGFSIEPVILR